MTCLLWHNWMGWSDPVALPSGQVAQVRKCRRCYIQKIRVVGVVACLPRRSVHVQGVEPK